MTGTLIGKQQQIADQALAALKLNQTDHAIYLSGEMGVGKTYIASYILSKLIQQKDHLSLVITPSIVTDKWAKILKDFTNPDKTTIIKLSPRKVDKQLAQYQNCNDHTRFIFVAAPNCLKSINGYVNDTYLFEHINLIVDEIQEYQRTRLKYIINLIRQTSREDSNILALTGTIFDGVGDNLADLLNVTNPTVYKSYNDSLTDLPNFMRYIWQYISVSISMEDLKEETQIENQNIQQAILPIDYLPLTELEQAFYHLTSIQAKHLGITNYKQIASDLLDNPEKDPIKLNRDRQTINHQTTASLLTLPLEPIAFSETKKYKALLAFLKNINPEEKVLIYANDPALIETLTQQLNFDGFRTTSFVKATNDIEQRLQKATQNYNIIVADPKIMKVGVDVSDISYLVWYQLLSTMTDILQAQRRITRLDSKTPSTVKFLAYDNTYQRELLDTISQANKNNAAAYGTKDQSNLTKLTGILLKGID